jgi:hypothetical protein
MSAVAYLNDDKADKKSESPLSMKKVAIRFLCPLLPFSFYLFTYISTFALAKSRRREGFSGIAVRAER